jgi:glucose/arabinose dehydrogenase
VVDDIGERGLLGVTFDPRFETNRFVYVYYTANAPTIHNRVARFTANGDTAAPGSEQVIIDLPALGASNHNGGAIHFGPDGKLYIAVGDNADAQRAQRLNTVFGKILRINRNGSIPSDNPFFGELTGQRRAIWALGLRNPYTFAFRPGGTRMYINDVGQQTWEEINSGVAGGNYGWPDTEGPTSDPNFIEPLHAYRHGSSNSTGCAITGGAFYRAPEMPFPAGYHGDYFYADYCSGWIRRYEPNLDRTLLFATGIARPVDLLVSPDGSLYYLAHGTGASTGEVVRVRYVN